MTNAIRALLITRRSRTKRRDPRSLPSPRSRASGRPGVIAMLLVAVLGACGGGLTQEQLTWCADNQAKVAMKALELGILARGTQFSAWKESDPEGYKRACRSALDDR